MIKNLILTLSIFVGQLFFVIISLFGISYMGAAESPLLIVSVLAINLFTIFYIVSYELIHKKNAKGSVFPYFIPLIIAFFFFIESAGGNVNLDNYAGQRFIFFCAYCIAPIYVANFCLRYNKFDSISKSLDIIMFISTIALILNTSKMSVELITIGGGGGRQETSYNAALCLGINLSYLILGDKMERYKIFKSKAFKIISLIFIPIQILITIMGRGRGGAVLLILTIIAVLFLNFKQNFLKIITIVTLFFLFSYIILVNLNISWIQDLLDVGLEKSFGYISGSNIDMEATGRDWVHNAIINLIKEKPIFGYGFFNAYSESFRVIQGYSHNIFLDVLLQGGIMYLIIFITVMVKVYSNLFKIIKNQPSRALLLPLALFPTVMLLFSGTYINIASFWFFSVFSFFYLTKKKKVSLQ